MIEQNATVVKQDQNYVWVETMQNTVCGQCSAQGGCGTAILGDYFKRRSKLVAVLKTIPVSEGDRVVIGLEEQALVRGSVAVYIVPLLFIFALGVLGETLSAQLLLDSEYLTVVLAILGLFLGALWLRRYGNSIKLDSRYQPVLLRFESELVPDFRIN